MAAPPPALVMHADWSVRPDKRWLALATLQSDGSYRAHASRPVGPLGTLWARLEETAGSGGHVLSGFDFPIGLPLAYADLAGITSFDVALRGFGDSFYDVAALPGQISLGRPFYPMKPGGCSRQQLLAGLGLARWSDLFRRCDRPKDKGPAACALFWTLGGQQVGKAAISGWRDLLAPALRSELDLAIWPFHGGLRKLLARHHFVVAETYPAEFYGHLGLNLNGAKRKQDVRQRNAASLLAWSRDAGVDLDQELDREIKHGFGAGANGEDRFDAVVGLFGMLNVLLCGRPSGEPDDPLVSKVEAWMLGRTAS